MKENYHTLQTIIYYCIGTTGYKELHKKEFANAVYKIEPNRLLNYLELFHISTLFYNALQINAIEHQLLGVLQHYIVYQDFFNKLVTEELSILQNHLIPYNIKPVILKGPAYWESLYPKHYLRRINDLDIILFDPESIEVLCDKLLNLNFSNVDGNFREKIYEKNHYEIPAFIKMHTVQVDEKHQKSIDYMIKIINKPGVEIPTIEKLNDNQYVFKLIVELHKGIYSFTNNQYPEMTLPYLMNSNFLKGYKIMVPAANLPYLSVKFIMDVERGSLKCLKLMVDFIRILEKITSTEINMSIQIAEKWKALTYYLTMLNAAKPLTPEIEYTSLKNVNSDPLSDLIIKGFNYGGLFPPRRSSS